MPNSILLKINKVIQSVALMFGLMFFSVLQAAPFFNETGQIPSSPAGSGGHQGIAWIDYDNDGDMDLFIPKSGEANRLYRNDSDGAQWVDVTTSAIQLSDLKSTGVAIGDYDGDGYDDIFVTNAGYITSSFTKSPINTINSLFHNVCKATGLPGPCEVAPGERKFTNVTFATMLGNEIKQSHSAAFGDMNGDGYLDIYVSNNGSPVGCNTFTPEGASTQNDLYINIPDPQDSSKRIFERQNIHSSDVGCTWVSALTDYDNDGDLDIFVVNDVFAGANLPTELFHNNLSETGVMSFQPVAASTGVDFGIAGMGIAIGDYNNDGLLDYYQTEFTRGLLATQRPDNTFLTSQLYPAYDSLGKAGWGAVFFDADQDGYEDLYSLNSNARFSGASTDGERSSFFHNNGNGGFNEISDTVGLADPPAEGVGVAIADYDNDGDMDMVVQGDFGNIKLFRNDTNNAGDYLKINLRGKVPNYRGLGAQVKATLSNGMVLTREVHAGSSLSSNDSPVVHFGLGSETVTKLTVNWLKREILGELRACTTVVPASDILINQPAGITVSEVCDTIYTLSGVITLADGSPVPNLGFSIFGLLEDSSAISLPVATDINGQYTQEVLNGTYAILLSTSRNYTLSSPGENVLVTIQDGDAVKDMIATLTATTLSGVIQTAGGEPLPPTTVNIANFDGSFNNTANVGVDGTYSIDMPVSETYYLVRPAATGYTFTETNGQPFLLANQEMAVLDFTADAIPPYTISGVVKTTNGISVPNLSFVIYEIATGELPIVWNVTTDNNGQYSLPVSNGFYVIYVFAGYILTTPATNPIIVDGANEIRDLLVTPN